MAIDTGIYNQLLRSPKTVQEYDNEAQTAQMNRLSLQSEQNKAAEYQRSLAAESALSRALASGGNVQNALAQGGFGSKALAYAKQQQEMEKSKADVAHVGAQTVDLTQKAKTGAYDLERKKHDVALQEVTSFNSPAEALASLEAHIKTGEMSPEAGAQMRQSIPQDPKEFSKWQRQTVMGLLDAKERMVYTEPTANTVATNNTSIATNAATNATSRANNQATVGASYANAAATREIAGATRDAAKITRDQGTEMKMADDYRAQSKPFKEVSDAYRQLNATLDKATTSPAATLAGATKFMKLLDPGSVVRESELMMALAATGVVDRAMNYAQTLKYGKVLTPAQVIDFKNITGQIYQAAQESQRAIDGNYQNQAKQYGLRSDMIVQDLGQNKAASPAASGVPADIADLLNKHGKK